MIAVPVVVAVVAPVDVVASPASLFTFPVFGVALLVSVMMLAG